MSRKNVRKETQTLSLSFLDAISCGFGAVILLFVIAKMYEPIRLEESQQELDNLIVRYQEELEHIVGETQRLELEQDELRVNVRADRDHVTDLESELARIRAELREQRDDAEVSAELAGQLARARQSLTAEMRELLADYQRPLDDYTVGGIPVDSEWLIFIIDTSESMLQLAWESMITQLEETLEVYPQLQGIQVMSDMGGYLFRSYRRGQWIPDSPEHRRQIVQAVRNWNVFSNSSPREGIIAAIRDFYDPEKKIALHIYGDDFAVGSINAVVREVDRLNRADEGGNRRVRIHAVAFPALWEFYGEHHSAADYATLMRALTQRNGGTFIALPTRRDMGRGVERRR